LPLAGVAKNQDLPRSVKPIRAPSNFYFQFLGWGEKIKGPSQRARQRIEEDKNRGDGKEDQREKKTGKEEAKRCFFQTSWSWRLQ
jgi:hypothetical protein